MLINPALPNGVSGRRKGWVKNAKKLALIALAASLVAASFSNSFFEIFCGLFLGLSLVCVLAEKKTEILQGPFALAAGIYLLVVALTVLGSGYPAESLRGVFRVLRCVLMSLFTVYLVDEEKKFTKLFTVFAASAGLIAVDALVQGFSGREFLLHRGMTPYTEEVMRVTGPFRHANDFAAYLSMTVFLFLGMLPHALRKGQKRERAWCFVGSLFLVSCLLWTYSRGAWLAVAVVYALMAVLKQSRALLLTLLVAIVLISALSPESLKGRVRSLRDSRNGTMVERRILWEEALRMTRERPWLGHGINTYTKIEPLFKSKSVYTDNQYAHNGYLQIAAETGWLGLGAFLAVILAFFAETLKVHLRRQNEFLSAAALSILFGVLSFLIHSATDTNLQSLRLVSLLWLAMGLVLAAKNIAQKHPR